MKTIFDSQKYWMLKRRKAAYRNIIIITIFMIIFIVYFSINYIIGNESKIKIKIQEYGELIQENNQKNIPLKTDIIISCINGKKVIIVNEETYYAGDIDTWGDIKGVNCE